MAMNMFILKKMAALTFMGLFPVIVFYSITQYFGFWWGLASLLVGVMICINICSFMIKNPFTDMLEGKGILSFNLDSAGILNPFIVQVRQPYITGKFNGKEVKDVWNRKSVFYMASPYKNKTPATIDDKGGLKLELDNAGLNKSRFALYQYPVLIYNSQISSFITKDVLSEKENSLFAEHSILFLNRQEEELTSQIRNFGRSVIELLKPQGNIFKNGWVWIIVVIVAIILIAMFAPHIMQVINGGAGQAVAKTIQQTAASTSQTITPLN